MIEYLCVLGGGCCFMHFIWIFKKAAVPRINFKMKSFHSSHLLIYLFSPNYCQWGLPGLRPTPFLTSIPALLPLAQAAPSTLASSLSCHLLSTLLPQGFHTYSSLCMGSSSPKYSIYMAHTLIHFRSLLKCHFVREMPSLATLYKLPAPFLSFFIPLTLLDFFP